MNVAKSVRLEKAAHPERFCRLCLWREQTRDGYRPCRRHAARFQITPAGRDALEESILAEQRRSELRVLDEQLEGAQ